MAEPETTLEKTTSRNYAGDTVSTRFTDLIGCRWPLQSAGMGLVAGVDLAAAVTNAGALGMLGPQPLPPDAFDAALGTLAERTDGRPFGVNFLMPFLDARQVELAARRAHLVEFFYGDPDPELIRIGHAADAFVGWQVGSADEARAAVRAGCDLLVAQGTEAGGHVRGTEPRDAILANVMAAVDVPVLAAGGIATAEQAAAALGAGADGVRVGTGFLAATEADVHPDYLTAILTADGTDTVLTEVFTLDWPEAPHRVLRSAAERARSGDGEVVGELTAGERRHPIPRFATMPPTRAVRGDIAAMALYAGQAVGAVSTEQPAAEIVHGLMSEIGSSTRRV
ncbi:MAG: nitronate monooxygenase [Pseudonocardiaceae bacterium]|nr:nitronate monooxygenase [Pseudonocardiaceae bacterium]